MGDEHTFRKVRLDKRDYIWLQLSSIKSVGRLDGQVLLETDTQTYQLDPELGARSPEQILADACGEGGLADAVPYLRNQVWEMLERKRLEEQAVQQLKEQREVLIAEIRRIRAEVARAGMSIVECGASGGLSISGGSGFLSIPGGKKY